MHELSIAQNIIDIIQEQAKIQSFSKVLEVRLKIGRLRAVEPIALDFCFGIVAKGTIVDGAKLVIENVSIRGSCQDCNTEFEIDNFYFVCPGCQGRRVNTTQGNELQVIDLEVD
jgi:hydrogenase nickel incorporation protein HypA/HybF